MNSLAVDREILRSNIEHHVEVFKKKVFRDRRRTTEVEIFKGTAAAATTALLGIGQLKFFHDVSDAFQVLAIVLTALLAIVTAWDGLFRHKALWILNISARNQFFELREDFDHAVATDTLSDEMLIEFYARYKKILKATNDGWVSMRKSEG